MAKRAIDPVIEAMSQRLLAHWHALHARRGKPPTGWATIDDIKVRCARLIRGCNRFGTTPPDALVELADILLAGSTPSRSRITRNQFPAYCRAIRFEAAAAKPPSINAVAAAAFGEQKGFDCRDYIRRWRKSDEYGDLIDVAKFQMKHGAAPTDRDLRWILELALTLSVIEQGLVDPDQGG